MRRGLPVKVAFHVDQLWFERARRHRHLREGDARRPPGGRPLDRISCGSGRGGIASLSESPLTSDGRYPGVEVPHSIRTLYPSWDVLGRPALPASLDDADIVHATNPAAVPPVRGDQRLVVTVHDLAFERFPELFPRDWRWLYRAGLRAAVKRADAILVPSQSTADDLLASTALPGSRVHVTPLAIVPRRPARRSRRGVRAPPGDPAVRVVGRDARAAQEPGAAGARVPAGRSRRPAHARAGGRARMARGSVGRGAREARPRDHRVDRRGVRRRTRCALPRRGRVRVSIVVRGVRPAGRRGDGARRADAHLRHIVAPRGRRRRRAPGGSDGRLRDRRRPRQAAHRSRVRGGSATTGPAARGHVHVGGHGPRYARRLPATDRERRRREGLADLDREGCRGARRGVHRLGGRADARARRGDRRRRRFHRWHARPVAARRRRRGHRDRRARREHRARPQRGDRRGGARRASP